MRHRRPPQFHASYACLNRRMSSIENTMLPETLNALHEAKLELQRQLARRPEYRALLIVDKAASELVEVLSPSDPPLAASPEIDAGDQTSSPAVAAEMNVEPAAELRQPEDCDQDPVVEAESAPEELSADPPLLVSVEESPAPALVMAEEPVKAASRAIDLFLSSSAPPAAPAPAPARIRSFLPFVAAPRLVKSAG